MESFFPDDKDDAMTRYLARQQGLDLPDAEDASFMGQALDYATRPSSAILGGIYGVVSPEVTPLEGFFEGLKGEEYYGAYNLLTAAGMDPESRLTRGLGLVGDIVNPLDPLNYVGFGFSGAAKTSRALRSGAKSVPKFFTRKAAARAGEWGALTIGGKAIGPRGLNFQAARAADFAGKKIAETKTYKFLARQFGGVRKFEKDFPGISRTVRAFEKDSKANQEGFWAELGKVHDGLKAKGLKDPEVEQVMRDTIELLETPEDKIFRINRELELLDATETGQFRGWRPDDVLDPVELDAFKAANELTQQSVDMRVGQLRLARREAAALSDEAARVVDQPNSRVTAEVFHGSPRDDIRSIKTQGAALGGHIGASNSGLGAYFSEGEDVADLIASTRTRASKAAGHDSPTIYGARINLENPLDLDRLTDVQRADLERAFPGFGAMEKRLAADQNGKYGLLGFFQEEAADAQSRLRGLGYDGVVVNTVRDVPGMAGKRRQYVVFDEDAIHVTRTRAANSKEWQSFNQKLARVEDELHVLQSVQVSRLKDDLPPEFTQIALERRAELREELSKVHRLWDEASDDARNTFKLLKPMIDDTRDIYEKILRRFDKKFEFPIDDYVKHMFPAHWSKLPSRVRAQAEEAQKRINAYATELANKGWDDANIEQAVRKKFKEDLTLVAAKEQDDVMKGRLDAFEMRKVDMTIDEVREAFKSGDLPWSFEDHSALVAAAMRRDATRWEFGYKIHDWIADQPGWTLKGEDYAALSKTDQKNWVAVDFHMPWIDPKKNPFRGTYMRKEVNELMQAQLRGLGSITTDEGLNAMLQAAHGLRRWWAAWTLAPFPSTRVRDLASDIILAGQGGLHPLRDLAKAANGESAYAASMAFQMFRKHLPDDRGAWKAGQQSLDNLTQSLSGQFGERVTNERLLEWMELEGILGANSVRDLDLLDLFNSDPIFEAARKKRSLASRAGDWAPFVHPARSKWIKGGFKVAEELADYTRTALFFDSLRKVAPEARNLDEALEFATANVRKHLFDYGDLTTFERQIMRLAFPFYTFSSKNLPLQINKMMTEPGRLQWVARLYEGAWGQYDDSDIKPEDLPHWLEDGLGLPMARVGTEDGTYTYAIWSPRGWLPQTELNEMADLIRGKAGTQILARLNPVLKEAAEQMLNTDAYTQRQIVDGSIRDVLGFVMEDLGGVMAQAGEDFLPGVDPGALDGLRGFGVPNSVARRIGHLLNNARLVTEMDRLDPGGAWTKLGRYAGWWDDERPHRFTAPGVDRFNRFMFGLNMKGVEPESQAERNMRTMHLDSNAARGKFRKAYREGNMAEAREYLETSRGYASESLRFKERLMELRRRRALDVAARETGR